MWEAYLLDPFVLPMPTRASVTATIRHLEAEWMARENGVPDSASYDVK